MDTREVRIYYLEMNSPADFVPKKKKKNHLNIQRMGVSLPRFNRFLYTYVGGKWNWTDKLDWNDEQWDNWVKRPELSTWIANYKGVPAGYYELEVQPENNIEIAYLGLFPEFIGKGLGGELLTAAIDSAWRLGASRIWVHTCTLDHPSALSSYKRQGFRVFKEEVSNY